MHLETPGTLRVHAWCEHVHNHVCLCMYNKNIYLILAFVNCHAFVCAHMLLHVLCVFIFSQLVDLRNCYLHAQMIELLATFTNNLGKWKSRTRMDADINSDADTNLDANRPASNLCPCLTVSPVNSSSSSHHNLHILATNP